MSLPSLCWETEWAGAICADSYPRGFNSWLFAMLLPLLLLLGGQGAHLAAGQGIAVLADVNSLLQLSIQILFYVDLLFVQLYKI